MWQTLLTKIQALRTPHWYNSIWANHNLGLYELQIDAINKLIDNCDEFETARNNEMKQFEAALQRIEQHKQDSYSRLAPLCELKKLKEYLNKEYEQLVSLCQFKEKKLHELKQYLQLIKADNLADLAIQYFTALEKELVEHYSTYCKMVTDVLSYIEKIQKSGTKNEIIRKNDQQKQKISASMETLQKFFSYRVHQCIRPLDPIDPDLIESIMSAEPETKKILTHLNDLLTKDQQEKKYGDSSHFLIIIGPQGVGKSILAEAAAHKTNFDEVIFIKGPVVGNEFSNSGSNCINDLFNPLLENDSKQWLVIIDEIDAIDGDQQEGRQRAFRGHASTILNLQLDSCERKNNITVIATTWRPERLQPDISSRFRMKFLLRSPDRELLAKILLQHLARMQDMNLDQTMTIEKIYSASAQFADMNIRDIQGIAGRTRLNGLTRNKDAKPFKVNIEDLKEAITNEKATKEFRGIPKKDDPVEQQKEQIEIARKNHAWTRNQVIASTTLGTVGTAATIFFGYKQWQLGKESLIYTKFGSYFAWVVTIFRFLMDETINDDGSIKEKYLEFF